MAASASSSVHPTARKLEESGVTKVAIVDDAFDPPVRSDFPAGQLASFVAAVADDDEAAKEIEVVLGKEPMGEADIANHDLALLCVEPPALKALRPHYDRWLDPVIRAKTLPLTSLARTLEEDLGREIQRCGQAESLPDASAQIVFLDYYLGPTGQAASVDRAKAALDAVDARYKGAAALPLVVLMSSVEVTPQMVSDFRDATGRVAGMFYFIRKAELANKDHLFIRLSTLAGALRAGNLIQRFTDSLSASIDRAGAQFVQDVRRLSLEDYAYVQMLCLQAEGQPLGDYMLWLYGAHFGHLLFQSTGVRAAQRALDPLTFRDLPPGQGLPSPLLAEMYRNTLFDTADDLVHPRSVAAAAAGPEPAAVEISADPKPVEPEVGDRTAVSDGNPLDQMYLHLGDLFVRQATGTVLMVMNAQCDLEFTPDHGGRQFKPAKSVLFIPGRLLPVFDALSEADERRPRTELFEFQGKAYRIVWDTKRIVGRAYEGLSAWLGAEGYALEARLRLPFALQIQQAFAADLTRIGMPVPPPLPQRADLWLCCPAADGSCEVLFKDSESAAFFATHEGLQCTASEEFVLSVRSVLAKAADNHDERAAHLASGLGGKVQDSKQLKEMRKNANVHSSAALKLRMLADDYATLLKFRGPFRVPDEDAGVQQLSEHACVVRGNPPEGSYRQKEYPLVLHVERRTQGDDAADRSA